MDPLSVMASLVGLLAAARHVVSILSKVKSSMSDAPRSMDHTISEVKAVEISISAIHKFLLGLNSAPRRRVTLIEVDQLLATLTEAVLTFSELEALVKPMVTGPEGSMVERVKWSWQEDKVASITLRLERHKSSLSLMLNIVQCESDLEAETSRDALRDLITQLLESNKDISKRLQNLEDEHGSILRSSFRNSNVLNVVEDPGEGTRVTPNELSSIPRESNNASHGFQDAACQFSFEVDLSTSRVYRRTQPYESDVSFTSSRVRTHAWSIFSGLSLSEISVISALALPLYAHDIPNNEWYSFGELGMAVPVDATHQPSPLAAMKFRNPNPTTSIPSGNLSRSTVVTMKLHKLVILGDEDVGIPVFTIQFALNQDVETYDARDDHPFRKLVVIDGQACVLEWIDTSGQGVYGALRSLLIGDGEGFLIVYSITNHESFTRTRKYHAEIQRVKSQFSNLGPSDGMMDPLLIPIMLVGNNCDRVLERQVSTLQGRELARELNCGFAEVSATDCTTAGKAFCDFARMIRRHNRDLQLRAIIRARNIAAIEAEAVVRREKKEKILRQLAKSGFI